jgi:hypothetical protein
MATTDGILEYAGWIEEMSPGFIAMVIMVERGKDYRGRDLLDQVACLIEIFWRRWRRTHRRVPLIAKATLISLAHCGIRRQRRRSRLRSPALRSYQTTGSRSVGAAFQLGAKFGVAAGSRRRA